MHLTYILNLIEQGESETIEFKFSFSKEVIETIVAFSNSRGGRIIIGCNDNKKIVGLTVSDESIQKWQNEVKQNTEPSVFPDFESVEIEDKTVVIITVDEFPLKPISFKNRYFIRKKNSNHLLSADEIVELRFVSLNYSFDSFFVKTTYNQLDKLALNYFLKRISETGRYVSKGDLRLDLEKLGLIIDGKLTRAAELLFGTHHTSIHIGRFKSSDTIIDDLAIRGPLVLAVEETMNFIKRNIPLSYSFTGELKRVERWKFPLQAIRELLLNAVVHKDYTNPTDIIVKIFDSSIEISNPGRLMSGLTLDDLLTDNYQARHRNKLLAEAFYLTGDIEKYGTGFIRIRKWMDEYPELNYKFSDLNGFLRVVLAEKIAKVDILTEEPPINNLENDQHNTHKGQEKGKKRARKGQEKGKKIIELITVNQHISMSDLSQLVGVSIKSIRTEIDKLKRSGKITRIGPDKGGYWQVNSKSES